ncbi:MAG: mechanosensitive ion channel domain-containing protein [Halioglobus sp.]
MEYMQKLLMVFWPFVSTLAGMALLLLAANWTAKRFSIATANLGYQLLNLLIIVFATITAIVALPLTDETQGQVLSLLGVVLTAVIAISSTTFVANAMAGVMLQATQPFRPGDFLRVGEQFGRVTKRSLVHTQMQTESRDLTTLPNLLLVNNPITVLHREGTIISAEISLGYDIPYTRIEALLITAAEESGLEEPYVMVQELLDHAVVYLVAGFLPEMKHLLTARSRLRKKTLEQMHGHGVEIVSPTFMNQRQLTPDKKIIPNSPVLHSHSPKEPDGSAPEDMIFDKAEEAANLEEVRQQQEEIRQTLKQLKAGLKEAEESARAGLEQEISALEKKAALISQQQDKDAASD